MLVPLMLFVRVVPPIQELVMYCPGAKMSTTELAREDVLVESVRKKENCPLPVVRKGCTGISDSGSSYSDGSCDTSRAGA